MERRAVVALGYLLCAPWQSAEAEERAGARAQTDTHAQSDVAVQAHLARLGSYEQDALQRALTARGLVVDPAPGGKIVRRIHVVNLPVFGDAEGFLTWFNMFHVTSRERMVA